MINFKKFNSIISFTAYFNSDDKCKQAIIESRWGVGIQEKRPNRNASLICSTSLSDLFVNGLKLESVLYPHKKGEKI